MEVVVGLVRSSVSVDTVEPRVISGVVALREILVVAGLSLEPSLFDGPVEASTAIAGPSACVEVYTRVGSCRRDG